jgi:hypothetical protein
MESKFERPLRLFVVNPFAIWADVALKAGQAMWSSYADAARTNETPPVAVIPTRVAVIPTADAPAPTARRAAKPARAKLHSKAKAKTKGKAKRRARR